jgi:hypothetical protein
MLNPGRPQLQTVYRVGATGVRITYRDGTVVQHAPNRLVMFSRPPLRVEGRLYLEGSSGATYEVQPARAYEMKS